LAQPSIGSRHHQRVHRHLAAFVVDDESEAFGKECAYQAAVARRRVTLIGPGRRWWDRRNNVEAIARHPIRPSEDLVRLQLIRVREELL
jgi:hypothetical protein